MRIILNTDEKQLIKYGFQKLFIYNPNNSNFSWSFHPKDKQSHEPKMACLFNSFIIWLEDNELQYRIFDNPEDAQEADDIVHFFGDILLKLISENIVRIN